MSEWHSKSLSIFRIRDSRHGLGGALVRLCIAGLFLAAAGSGWASVISFDDDFESYTEGTNLDGSNGWAVAGSGSVTVTNHLTSQRAALIPNSSTNVILENDFTDNSNVVSIAFDLQPVYTDGDPSDLIPADATFVYYIGTNGMVTAYDGYQNPSNLTHDIISDQSPTNFLVTLDYANSNWSLYVGGVQIVPGFDFYSSSNSDFNQIAFLESSSTSYLDNVDIDAPPLVYFDVASNEYAEGSTVTVTARLSTAYGLDVTTIHSLAAGDAADLDSYSSDVLTFNASFTVTNFTIVIEDDDLAEEAETVVFELSDVTNGVLGSPSTFTLNILDDPLDWSLPFYELFESRTLGALNGQNGWRATDVEVQTNTFIDTQAASITSSTGIAYHPFGDGQSNVWTDLYIQPAFGDNSSTNPPDESSFAFFVNNSSNVVVYNGNATQALTGVTVTPGEWVRFTVFSDYTNSNWDLYVDGVLVTNDVNFYTNTAPPNYQEFGVRGGGSSSVPFDDVYISTNPPAPFVTFSVASNFYDEGSTATGYVALSWASASNVTVNLTDLLTGTATNGGLDPDYTFSSPSNLTINAGETNLPFTFVIEQDDLGEQAETIKFGLGSFDGGVAGAITNFTAYINIDTGDVPDISFETNAVSIAESTGIVTVTVEVSVPYNIDTVKVDYAVSGTATLNTDYTNYTGDGTLVINPGDTNASFSFEVIDDLEDDGPNTIIFGLTNFINCSDGMYTQITYTILKDIGDVKPEVTFAAATDSGAESVTNVVQTVYLSKSYNGTVTVDVVDTGGGTASDSGVDYTFATTQLVFATTVTSQTFTVQVNDDLNPDGDETIVFGFDNLTNCSAGTPSSLEYTILEDIGDVQPNVYFASSNAVVSEGVGTVTQKVYLSKTYNGTVTIDVEDMLSGTATNGGVDYSMGITNLTFSPLSTSEEYTVVINNDTIGEDADTIDLQLSNVSGATIIAPSTHTITILDDVYDWGLPFYETFEARVEADLDGQHGWDALDATVQSNNTYAGSTFAGSVNSETGFALHPFSDGKSNVWTDIFIQPVFADDDSASVTDVPEHSTFAFYVNTNGDVVVYDGNVRVTNDTNLTKGEWVRFTVYSDYAATNWALYTNGSPIAIESGLAFYTNTITSYTEFGIKGAGSTNAFVDDVSITLTSPLAGLPIANFFTATGSGAESVLSVTGTVVLTKTYANTVTVDHVLLDDGAAVAGQDYNYSSGKVTFEPGEQTNSFTFTVINDTDVDGPDTLTFSLSGYSNAIAGTTTNFAYTILADNDDVPPDISFVTNVQSAAEGVTSGTGTVYLTKTYSGTVTVDHAVIAVGTTADIGDDYTYSADTLTFDPYETNASFFFTIVNDTYEESDETIKFGLSSPSVGSLTPYSNFTYTILEDTNDWYALPFVETFEARTPGDLSGQHGWYASDTYVTNAPAAYVHTDSLAGLIMSDTGMVRHTFNDGQSNVWTDLYIKPVFGANHDSVTNPLPGSSFAFYVYTNGQVVAFNGRSSPTQLTHAALTPGSWTRFTVFSDYANTNWDLYLDGTQLIGGLHFVDPTAPTSYSEFGVRGAGSSNAPIDDVNITLTTPFTKPSGTMFLFR